MRQYCFEIYNGEKVLFFIAKLSNRFCEKEVALAKQYTNESDNGCIVPLFI